MERLIAGGGTNLDRPVLKCFKPAYLSVAYTRTQKNHIKA